MNFHHHKPLPEYRPMACEHDFFGHMPPEPQYARPCPPPPQQPCCEEGELELAPMTNSEIYAIVEKIYEL